MKDWTREEVIRAVENGQRSANRDEIIRLAEERKLRDYAMHLPFVDDEENIGRMIEQRVAAREASMSPRQRKRMDRFVEAADDIAIAKADEENALFFTARLLTQVSLPHSKRDGNEYMRRSGKFQMHVLAPSKVGLPFGHYPRLLLTWITTEAVRSKSSTLELGDSLSAFMSELGLAATGGRWGTIPRLQDHMKRLFSSTISWTYEDGATWLDSGVRPVEKAALWWDPKKPEQAALFQSTIKLSPTFYDEIVRHPVPVDMRALRALAHEKSPLAIDIYTWLTHRMSYLQKPTTISWSSLHAQFGGDYSRVRKFKEKFIERLKLVVCVYQAVRVDVTEHGLKLAPSPTSIPFRNPATKLSAPISPTLS